MASKKETQSSANSKRAPPPALDPENPGLTQPWKDFSSKGWIQDITIKKTPFGWNMTCQVAASVNTEAAGKDIALGVAKQLIVDAGLWTPKGPKAKAGKDSENPLPKKSLVKDDFKDPGKLASRAAEVASALRDTTARGRIGSLKLMLEGVDTFEEWWRKAPPSSKVRLLMDEKHFKQLTDTEHLRFSEVVVSCPFRGAVPAPAPEGDGADDSEDEDPPRPPPQRKAGSASPPKA